MPDTEAHHTNSRADKAVPKQHPHHTKTTEKTTEKSARIERSADQTQHRAPRRPAPARSVQSTITDAHGTPPSDVDDLTPTVLALGSFREIEWPEQNFNGYDAHGVDFCAAVLSGICALGANFADAQLEETQLQNAAFCGANLTKANLRHANLRNANLSWCDLRDATLFAADLRGANLTAADLRDADLREANLSGAYYSRQTKWPADFDHATVSMVCLNESR